jgi:diaminopimelate epimerase
VDHVHVTKHHGLGNDFLVALGRIEPNPELARRLCDRRRGIGADGLIVGQPNTSSADVEPHVEGDRDVDVVMVLYNSDGSRAAMSGNGIRCLAQAVAQARSERETSLTIRTDAGIRTVEVVAGPDPATVLVHVDMGAARPGRTWTGGLPDGLERRLGSGPPRLETVDIGNPHVVLLADDPAAVDLERFGPALERAVPGGTNVEFIARRPGVVDELDLTVWERGAGRTEACGTGASAAAWVAHRWGLVGTDVVVHLPGGDVRVQLGSSIPLSGPATFVGRIEVGPELSGAPDATEQRCAAGGSAVTDLEGEHVEDVAAAGRWADAGDGASGLAVRHG